MAISDNDDLLFEVDFTGMNDFGGEPPTVEGVFTVELTGVRPNPNNPQRCWLDTVVTEVGFQGHAIGVSMGIVGAGGNDKAANWFWRTVLRSIGYPADKIGRRFKLKRSQIVGKTAYVKYVPGGEGAYSKTEFISEDRYNLLKKAYADLDGSDAGFEVEEAPKHKAKAKTKTVRRPAKAKAKPAPAPEPEVAPNGAAHSAAVDDVDDPLDLVL